jgi:hypothetical protein
MNMVKKISLLSLVVTLTVCFSIMNVDNAYGQGSPVYIGEYCWEGGGGFLRMGLTHMGGGHVSFSGLVTMAPNDWAMNGNLEIVGNSVLVTATESAALLGGTYVFSRVSNATLDLSTLDGTGHFMDMTWDGAEPFLDYYTIDLTYVDCGSDQSSDGVGKKEELIRFLRKYSSTPEE